MYQRRLGHQLTASEAVSPASTRTDADVCSMRQAYYFPIWDLNSNWDGNTLYGRWSINMFLFKGSEMGNVTEHDDEAQITTVSLTRV